MNQFNSNTNTNTNTGTSFTVKRHHVIAGIIAIILLLILAACLHGKDRDIYAGGDSKNARPEITVTGKGEAFAIPNVATFSFTDTEQGKTVQEAQDKATKKTNAVIAYLKNAKIEDKDVKTLSYTVNPHYEYAAAPCIATRPCQPGKQVLTGYEVSQTVQVKVKDTTQAGTILSGIGGLEVQNVSGLEFTVDDEDAVKADARAKAITDAKNKAEELSGQLGVRLVRITSFTEQGDNQPPVMYGRAAVMDQKVSESAAVPQLPAGENKMTSNVTITYEIR